MFNLVEFRKKNGTAVARFEYQYEVTSVNKEEYLNYPILAAGLSYFFVRTEQAVNEPA